LEHLLFKDLLLPFGLLQACVLLGVDLGEAVQLLPQGADLFFELVALAPLGPQGIAEAAVVCTGSTSANTSNRRTGSGRGGGSSTSSTCSTAAAG
jgi:hypothetical protein